MKKYSFLTTVTFLALAAFTPAVADAPFELRSDGGRVGMTSFNANGTGYAAYATPTDMVGICGSATRTVFVTNAYISIGSTSGALQTVFFINRSTADTGGTPTSIIPTAYDSLDDGLASATVKKFGAAPTMGTSTGTLRVVQGTSSVLTAPYTVMGMNSSPYVGVDATKFTRPVVLRGVNDCLYLNYGGAALTSGFAAQFGFDWSEFGPVN